MTTLWNQRELAEPPVICTVVSLSPENTDCLSTLREILQECVSQLGRQSHLSAEKFALSALTYKSNCQLRSDKSLQGLKLISKCLARYSDVNVYQLAVRLLEGFDSYTTGSVAKENLYLPSRQVMEHFLVKLMGVTCVLSQTVNYAVHTFIPMNVRLLGLLLSLVLLIFPEPVSSLLQQRLRLGHLITINLVFLSAVARVWSICKSMALTFVSWYARLLPTIHALTPTDIKWMPDNDSLPEDLAEFVYSVTGCDIRTSDQEHNLIDMFDKIRSEHEESLEGEGQIDSEEPGVHGSSGRAEDENYIYSNNEDIGVPIKKKRRLNPKEEHVRKTPKILDEVAQLPSKKDNFTNRQNLLGCVKTSHNFNELKSVLNRLKKQTPLSQEFLADWKMSLTAVKQCKTKSSPSEGSGEESTEQMKFLKKAKRSIRNLVNKYCKLTDSSRDQNANLSCTTLDEEKQEFKLVDSAGTDSDHNLRSKLSLDLDLNLSTEVKTKRNNLKKVIKRLRTNSHFEHEGKIINLSSVESEKLRKQLQQLLKNSKKLSTVKKRDFQREIELLNGVDSLLEKAAVEKVERNRSVLQTQKNSKNKGKRKIPKSKEGKLHVHTGLEEMQNKKFHVIKTKKLKKLKKGSTVGKKR